MKFLQYKFNYLRVTFVEYYLYIRDDTSLIYKIPIRLYEEVLLYVKFWIAKFTNNPKNPKQIHELHVLNAEMKKAPDIFKPSYIWKDIFEQFERVLYTNPLQNFKSQRYNTRFSDPTPISSDIYERYLWMYWSEIKKKDSLNLLQTLDEPRLGGAKTYTIQGKKITHDLLQSIDEFYAIFPYFPNNDNHSTILELGAGYGRLAYVFSKAMKNNTYIVVDMPGSLIISQYYLSRVFSKEKILTFQESMKIKKFTKKTLSKYQIVFLTPWQLPDMSEKTVDIFINIYSFQEMTTKQISNYYILIDRICKNLFFSKQLVRSYNPKDELIINQKDYPKYKHWEKLFERLSSFNETVFEVLYRLTDQ